MKNLKIIGIIIAAIVILFLIAGIIAPKNFDVHRSITINASNETVWKAVSTFEQFNKWNPWNKMDSNVVVKLEGTDGTVGCKRSWAGNRKVGEGSMTISKIDAEKNIEYAIDFIKPFEAHNTGYFNLENAGSAQKVTWGMKGSVKFPFNAFLLFMNMDKQGGKDFEEGLANLKTLCEAAPAAKQYEVNEIDWAEKNCLSVRETVNIQDLSKFYGANYAKLFEAVTKAGAKPGIPLGVYYKYDAKEGNADVAAAIPYEGKKVLAKGFSDLNLPARKGYEIDYFGPYNEEMKKPYAAMDARLKTLGKENPDLVIEEYVTDPMSEKDSTKWLTKIYFFVN